MNMKTIIILLLVSLSLSVVQSLLTCPPPPRFDPEKGCGVRKYQCCKNSDCPWGEFCCAEHCGYRCRPHVDENSGKGGGKVVYYDTRCERTFPFP
ncbi:unnamed protein product, partial [Larinioides sclopetarius]